VRLSRDLNEHTDLDLAYDAVEAWMPGIELCDTRWLEGEKADPLLRLADQQLSRALIAGKPQLFRKSLNWNEQKVSLLVNGVSHIFGKVGHPFIDPLSSLLACQTCRRVLQPATGRRLSGNRKLDRAMLGISGFPCGSGIRWSWGSSIVYLIC
jgi:hypothetical protein